MSEHRRPDRRRYAGQTVALLLTAVTTVAGCAGSGAGGAPDSTTPPKERASVNSAPPTGTTAIECGQPFRPPTGGPLALTARFPTTASLAEGRVVTGTVEATSQVAVRGVVTPRADVFLVGDGRVTTVPTPQDAVGVRWSLAAGQVERLPADLTLAACGEDAGPVPPGTYQLYARVVLTPDDGAAGVESFGGPWPIEVR